MDKKSKIFFSVFFIAVFIVTAASFCKFYIFKDYYITSEAACDPAAEQCFIYECDPADDNECPENPAERLSYYKLIEKKAKAMPVCNPNGENCPPLACRAGEDCREILCDEAARISGESCSEPAMYLNSRAENEDQAPDDAATITE
ncbi:MAG: hypothetical protein PHS62_05335 [Patescibacteria group bacterium]|nr:hypothetical protein [Patescibacteria group bacterium]